MGGGASRERTRLHAAVAAHNKKVQSLQAAEALAAYQRAGIAPPPSRGAGPPAPLANAEGPPITDEAGGRESHPAARPARAAVRPNTSLPADHFRKKLEDRRSRKQRGLAGSLPQGKSSLSPQKQRGSAAAEGNTIEYAAQSLSRPNTAPTSMLSKLDEFLFRPQENEVDRYWTEQSDNTWHDINEVSAVMAAKSKAREERLNKIRAEEQRRLRIAQEARDAELECKRLEQLAAQAELDNKDGLEGQTEGRRKEMEEEYKERQLKRAEEVHEALEEFMRLEFNSEEEFYETLAEYVDIMRMVEEEEEKVNRKRRELYYDDGVTIPKELQAFLPGYMSDLMHESRWSRVRRMRSKKKKPVPKAEAEYDSDEDDAEHPRRGRGRRRRRLVELSVGLPEETELEVLLDQAAEKGFAEVARLLSNKAKIIALAKTKRFKAMREKLAKKAQEIPGYHMYYRPFKKQIQRSYQGAKKVMDDVFAPNIHAVKVAVADMKSRIRAFRNMEMGDEWKQQNRALNHVSENVGYGLNLGQRLEDLDLIEHKTVITRHQQLMDRKYGTNSSQPADRKRSNAQQKTRSVDNALKKPTIQTSSDSDDYDDEYVEAESVGAILATEGDKRGRYFGEVKMVLDEPQRHGYGVLQQVTGARSTLAGQWSRNVLHGFAIEIHADGSYCIGLYEQEEISQIGWQRPQRGAKYGYCGMFERGKPHGYGFRVLLSQRVSRAKSTGQVQSEGDEENSEHTKMPEERQEGILTLSALLAYEKGKIVEQIDLPEIELEGFKRRVGQFLRLAFVAVKEAGEYTDMDLLWLSEGEQLLMILTPDFVPLAGDKDFRYLEDVVDAHSRPASALLLSRIASVNTCGEPAMEVAPGRSEGTSASKASENVAEDYGSDDGSERGKQTSLSAKTRRVGSARSSAVESMQRSSGLGAPDGGARQSYDHSTWEQSSIYSRPPSASDASSDISSALLEGKGVDEKGTYTRPSSGGARKLGKDFLKFYVCRLLSRVPPHKKSTLILSFAGRTHPKGVPRMYSNVTHGKVYSRPTSFPSTDASSSGRAQD